MLGEEATSGSPKVATLTSGFVTASEVPRQRRCGHGGVFKAIFLVYNGVDDRVGRDGDSLRPNGGFGRCGGAPLQLHGEDVDITRYNNENRREVP